MFETDDVLNARKRRWDNAVVLVCQPLGADRARLCSFLVVFRRLAALYGSLHIPLNLFSRSRKMQTLPMRQSVIDLCKKKKKKKTAIDLTTIQYYIANRTNI